MSQKRRDEWKEFIQNYNKPLNVRERHAKLKFDHAKGMYYLEVEGLMATKEVTSRVVQELLKSLCLPDEVYNAVREEKERIVYEREACYFRQQSDNAKKEGYRDKEGYVYFLKEYIGELVKIGHSKQPYERQQSMLIFPTVPVEIIHTIRSKDAYRLEQMFHTHYARKKIRHVTNTELFELTEEDLQDIYNRRLPEEMKLFILEEELVLPQ